MSTITEPVDEKLPAGKLFALGMPHVLVMYAGAIAVPLIIVAVSIGVGMIPLVAPTFFKFMPAYLSTILHSGILLTSIMAVLLNLFFNGKSGAGEARKNVLMAAQSSEH